MVEEYLSYMKNLKFKLEYINCYIDNSYRVDRGIAYFLAITSVGGIGAWTIWSKLAYVWGIVIAVSQVISAVRYMLPFGRRIEVLNITLAKLSDLFCDMEYEWNNIKLDKYSDDELNKLLYDFKKKGILIEREYYNKIVLPNSKRMIEEANKIADDYFEGETAI